MMRMQLMAGLLFCVTLVGLAGCTTVSSTRIDQDKTTTVVDAISLYSLPAAVNMDGSPGADGIRVRLYFFRVAEPLAVPFLHGSVEVLMYDGRVLPANLGDTKPSSLWQLSAEELRRVAMRSDVGIAYDVPLYWANNAPQSRTVTLSARIVPKTGRALYAQPTYISVVAR